MVDREFFLGFIKIHILYHASKEPIFGVEIVKELAEEFEESPNGVRMILTKAGVYVKKTAGNGTAKAATGGTRVSKAAAQEALIAAIEAFGAKVDEELIGRLTGKAAQYFADILKGPKEEEVSE